MKVAEREKTRMSMHTHSKRGLSLCLALLVILVLVPTAQACNVPVFRYALERWRVDSYELVLFHKGPLTEQQQKIVEVLKVYEEGQEEGVPRCLTLEVIDLEDKDLSDDVKKLWETQKAKSTPWLAVYAPIPNRVEPVWAGSPEDEMVRKLLFSPARRIVAERILKGQTAVCLLLEGKDKDKTDKLEAILKQELPKMPTVLKLPELTDDPADALLDGAPPLKIDFSILRVSRNDPMEQGLVKMLLHSEADLTTKEFKDEPMAFFVFGRGRAYWALVGDGITADNITDVCRFLTGACSCEVKRQNPGFDLLVDVDWEAGLTGRYVPPPEPPTLTSSKTLKVEPIDLAPPTAENTTTVAKTPFWETPLFRTVLIVVAVVGVLLVIGTVFVLKRG